MNEPTTLRGQPRAFVPAVPPEPGDDLSPRLPAQSVPEMIRSILANPAPVPDRAGDAMLRRPTTVRERITGDNEHSTPTERAMAALIRSLPVCLVMVLVGIVMVMVTPLDDLWLVATVLGVLGTLLYYNIMEYRHSQAGVERQRTKNDHRLDIEHERNRHQVELEHEQNRHAETMEAIRGDIEIKLRVLDLAAGNRQLADRPPPQLTGGD